MTENETSFPTERDKEVEMPRWIDPHRTINCTSREAMQMRAIGPQNRADKPPEKPEPIP